MSAGAAQGWFSAGAIVFLARFQRQPRSRCLHLRAALLCLLIAGYDFKLVERIDAVQPLTIAVSAAYFAIALRYWFNAVMIMTGAATACFIVAAVLSA